MKVLTNTYLYCLASNEEESDENLKTYAQITHCLRHIKNPSDAGHVAKKVANGWGEDDWESAAGETKKKRLADNREWKRKRSMKHFAISYSNEVALKVPQPHLTIPGIHLGSPPPKYEHPGIGSFSKLPEPWALDKLAGVVISCELSELSPITIPGRNKGNVRYL